MKTTFTTEILAAGNNTGIEVPAAKLAELGAGKKPPVVVTVGGYSYQSTVAVMGGKFVLPLSKAHREAAQLKGGDRIEVTLELETAPRTVEVPHDLAAALADAGATERFAVLAASRRKEHARQVEEARTAETRARRIAKIVAELGGA